MPARAQHAAGGVSAWLFCVSTRLTWVFVLALDTPRSEDTARGRPASFQAKNEFLPSSIIPWQTKLARLLAQRAGTCIESWPWQTRAHFVHTKTEKGELWRAYAVHESEELEASPIPPATLP